MAADFQHRLFLDTNAVHFARLYIIFAKEHSLPPVGDSADDPKDKIKQTFSGGTQNSYQNGRRLVDYLLQRSEDDWRIEYSPVAQLELASGLLRGKAMLEAASEGFTHRMWNRMDEREILDRLSPEHFAEVAEAISKLGAEFQSVGIDLIKADPNEMSEVWTLASQVIGVTFLDLGDCAVYASALLAEADEILTNDGYFREIVSNLENPGGAKPHQKEYFQEASRRLKKILVDAISVSDAEVKLPTAPKNW